MTMSSALPDDDIGEMQREEVEALEAIFEEAIEIRSSRDIETGLLNFPISYCIKLDSGNNDAETCHTNSRNWPKHQISVEIQYPLHYPSDEDDKDPKTTIPTFRLSHENTVLEFPSFVSEKLLTILRETAEEERGMPCVLSCIYAAREFLDQDRLWKNEVPDSFKEKCSLGTSTETLHHEPPKIHYVCISTHHLLDHKPDNILRNGHKSKLSGFYKFGTPGVAVGWGEKEDIAEFVDVLKRAMPQKKFEIIFSRVWDNGVIPSGWNAVDPPTLKKELSNLELAEKDYFTILGLKQSETESSSSKGRARTKNKK